MFGAGGRGAGWGGVAMGMGRAAPGTRCPDPAAAGARSAAGQTRDRWRIARAEHPPASPFPGPAAPVSEVCKTGSFPLSSSWVPFSSNGRCPARKRGSGSGNCVPPFPRTGSAKRPRPARLHSPQLWESKSRTPVGARTAPQTGALGPRAASHRCRETGPNPPRRHRDSTPSAPPGVRGAAEPRALAVLRGHGPLLQHCFSFQPLYQVEKHFICAKTAEAGTALCQSHSTGFKEERKQTGKYSNTTVSPVTPQGV